MLRQFALTLPTMLALATIGWAQTVPDFQVRYVTNLDQGDSVINITNDGQSSNSSTFGPNGTLCVGVYAFDPSEELLSCDVCLLTPNALVSLSARGIINNLLTKEVPTSLVIKLLSWPATNSSSCDFGSSGTPTAGMHAWTTTLHALPTTPATFGVTETPFSPATLSQTEFSHIIQLCAFDVADSFGYGIGPPCLQLGR